MKADNTKKYEPIEDAKEVVGAQVVGQQDSDELEEDNFIRFPRAGMESSTPNKRGISEKRKSLKDTAKYLLLVLGVQLLLVTNNPNPSVQSYGLLAVLFIAIVALNIAQSYLSKEITCETVEINPNRIEVCRWHCESPNQYGSYMPTDFSKELMDSWGIYEVDSWKETSTGLQVNGVIVGGKAVHLEDLRYSAMGAGQGALEALSKEVARTQKVRRTITLRKDTHSLELLKECLDAFVEAKKHGKEPDEGIHLIMDRINAGQRRSEQEDYDEMAKMFGGSGK